MFKIFNLENAIIQTLFYFQNMDKSLKNLSLIPLFRNRHYNKQKNNVSKLIRRTCLSTILYYHDTLLL